MTTDIAATLLSGIKSRLGPAWEQRFDQVQRELVEQCCADAADLQVRALAAPKTAAAQLDLLRDKAHINAQLCNIADCEAGPVASVFWEVVQSLVTTAVTIAFAAI